MSVYLVTGRNEFRSHKPGETFEASLDPLLEVRAIRRGNIELVERSTPCLIEGSYRLPQKAADAAGRGADAHQDPDQGRRPHSA